MAESKETMARVARLEREGESMKEIQGRTIAVLADLGQRLDHVTDELSHRIDHMSDELNQRIDGLRDSLEGRLDRLIAVTTQERTYAVERFASIEQRTADIERRLAKLEARKN